ncbi:hypothetical protein Tco_0653700 [Tanacetum coccineum]|uniref:Uncharacterized protein n=1 Tax=Tanacetum coccineum TaxID=301880 RepID=A0ABQ4X154_9ASTR
MHNHQKNWLGVWDQDSLKLKEGEYIKTATEEPTTKVLVTEEPVVNQPIPKEGPSHTEGETANITFEEAEKIGLDHKKVITQNSREVFKKAQADELKDLNLQRNEKVRKAIKLRNNKLKYYKDFRITELDELREIIPKRKNNVVSLMMNSFGKRYEKIKKLPEELEMQLALPPPVTETSKAKCLGRKRKQMELEPETVIGISLKAVIEAIVSYLVMAATVQTVENARFGMNLRKLIADHPDQEKLKSKKVKLEVMGYSLD